MDGGLRVGRLTARGIFASFHVETSLICSERLVDEDRKSGGQSPGFLPFWGRLCVLALRLELGLGLCGHSLRGCIGPQGKA